MKKFFENKPRAIFSIGAIFVLLIAILGVSASLFLNENITEEVDPNLLIMVGDEKIMKSDLEEKYYGIDLSGTSEDQEESLIESKGYDDTQSKYFMDLLVEETLIRKYADENGVSVTKEEAEKSAKESIKEWDLLTDYQKEVTIRQHTNNLLREKTIEKIVTWKTGRYVEIHFDRHFVISDALSNEKKAELQKTQDADIKEDKEYADDLKDEIYADLQSGKITFNAAMEKVRKDKFIDYTKWDFSVADPGVEFDTLNAPEESNLLEWEGFGDALKNTKKGELAEPFVRKLDYGDWKNNKVDMVDSTWVLLKVDDEYIGKTTSINQWFSDKKGELGIKSYVDWYDSIEKISYDPNVAHAWNSTACTSGRYNQGSSHPGDLISEFRMITASGSNVPVSGSYSYVRHGDSRAYAYSGCPLLSGYTVGNYSGYGRSEASNSVGCMYRFSSVYSSTFNLCCSGYHNPHQWKLGKAGVLEDKGFYNHRYYGVSTGSAWYGPYYGQFSTGYGQRYSDPSGNGVDITITNGKTVYMRGYWKVNPNIAPTATRVSQSISGSNATLTCKITDPDPGDSGKVAIRPKLRYRPFGGSWGSWYTPDYSTNYGWLGSPTYVSSSNQRSKTISSLADGDYQWLCNGRDIPGLYDDSDTGSFRVGTPVQTSGCNCSEASDPSRLISSSCAPSNGDSVYDNHVEEDCEYTTPGLTCTPSPQEGLAPLVVKFDISGANLISDIFDFFPGDGQDIQYTLSSGSRTIYYTYDSASSSGYDPYIVSNDTAVGTNGRIECGSYNIGVSDPSDSEGGEVAP